MLFYISTENLSICNIVELDLILKNQFNKTTKRKADELDSDSDSDNEQKNNEISESLENLDDIKNTLKQVENAIILDKQLPENHKSNNSHLKPIQEEFSSFFDEDSGNNIQQGLKEVKDYLNQEKKSLEKLLQQCSYTNQPSEKQKPNEYIDEQISTEMPNIFDDSE